MTIVRPRTILGHGRLGIFGILFDWIADGADPFVLGDGSNRYQFVHADDLADGLPARRRPAPGPAIFNVGTDRFGTMREALEHLCAHAGTGAEVRSLPAGPTALAMRASAAARPHPVRPVPLADVRAARCGSTSTTSATRSAGRRGGRPTRCSPRATTGSSPTAPTPTDAGALAPPAHGPRPALLGALKRVTRLLPRAGAMTRDRRVATRSRLDAASPSPCWPLLAYVPALLSSPGRMPADTKLYLYLDPGRLIADAPWTFDGRQFAGWVPHQVIAYLWPQGPWYWLGDGGRAARLGRPPAVDRHAVPRRRHRRAVAGPPPRPRRSPPRSPPALVYQLSPYVLPYVSRTSAMLLPWAGLGWIVGLHGRARRPARGGATPRSCALVIATVGAVNATALLMVAPAPVLWLLDRRGRAARSRWRRAVVDGAAHRRCCRSACRCGGSRCVVDPGPPRRRRARLLASRWRRSATRRRRPRCGAASATG